MGRRAEVTNRTHLSTSVGNFVRPVILGMLLALLFTSLFGCGSEDSVPENTSQPVQTQPMPNPFLPITPIVPPDPNCSRDLAGTCRHNPPSMGALEVS